MARINYSDNIRAQGRQLYLQTNTLEEGHQIVSALYDGGRILHKENLSYRPDVSEHELEIQIREYHNQTRSSIELLYQMSVRVKTVRHAPSLIRLGRQFLKWSLLDEAIGELELALQYDAKEGDAYCLLGRAYLMRKSVDEAVDTLKKGCKQCEHYADLWHQLGVALLTAGNYREAMGTLQRSLKINRSYDEAHLSLAICYLHMLAEKRCGQGVPEEAVCKARVKEHINRTAALSVRFQTQDFEEAVRRFHANDIASTLSILESVQKNMPVMVDLDFQDLFYLNYLYGERGRNAKDIQSYVEQLEVLTKRFPRYPDLHNHLGIGYLIECRVLFSKALQQFRAAVEINPEYEKANRNLKLAENDGKGLLILLRALLK